ncbi:family 78 glycoside hydrolase catalytic domain [Lactiplantibacillus modestisalitolerans]|uniref:Family 78 glycoside hydrolase catalytic domain n=2 Tax=Lactiplantibacillus modestisalitolerans TaxID=1457219 RepID=A0ABV5WVX9_9LACO
MMTYSFVNDTQTKFQVIDEGQFRADPSLLAVAQEQLPLATRQVTPQRVAVIQADVSLAEQNVTWRTNLDAVTLQPGERLVYDLGTVVVGHFEVAIESCGSPMDAPLLLQARFAERLLEVDLDASKVESWLPLAWIQDDRRHVELLPATVTYERRYSCRYVVLTPVGQSLKWCPRLTRPEFTATSAVGERPVAPLTGGPAWLRRLDAVCIATLRNTMQAVYEDGTKRDRRLWLLDFRMQAKVNYVTFKDRTLARRCLYLFASFADDAGRLPADVFTRFETPQADDLYWFDYQLQFVMALAEYGVATGDLVTVRALEPIASRAMTLACSQLSADGLMGARTDVFVDWSTDCDKQTAVQALLVQAVRAWQQIAQLVDKPALGTTATDWLETVVGASLVQTYDAEQHLFVSGPKREVSLLTQVYMLLADVLPVPERQRCLAAMRARFELTTALVTPSTQGLLAEVLFKYGETDAALAVLKAYWGPQLAQGATTCAEVFAPADPDYSPYGSPLLNSYCFGWGSYPAYLLRVNWRALGARFPSD